MRITGGNLRGRALKAPEGMDTRPTTDRVREALFDILSHHDWGQEGIAYPEGHNVLDAFAGTGGLGLDSLSRGATRCCFFEKDRNAMKCLKENISSLGLENSSQIFFMDVLKPPKAEQPCSLVFMDPPYRKGLIPESLLALEAMGWLAPQTLVVTETAKGETIEFPPSLESRFSRRYGDTVLGFWIKGHSF